MITSGEINIRPMLDTAEDYQLMTKWLSDPRIYKFIYGKSKNLKWVKNKYGPRSRKEEPVNSCFIEFKNQPIGYIQYFNIKPHEKDYEMENTQNVWAIDMWIGEPDFWDKGIGSRTLNLLVDYIFKNQKAKKIIIDPHVNNPRAIRVYEKVGFKKVKILKSHESFKDTKVDAWLMEINNSMHF